MPGVAVLAAAVVVDAAAEIASPPPASPAATGIAAVVVEPRSYSAPPPRLYRLLTLGNRLPHEGSVTAAELPRPGLLMVPAASVWWPVPAPRHSCGSGWSAPHHPSGSGWSSPHHPIGTERPSSSFRIGTEPTLYLWRSSGSFPFPFPAGSGPPWQDSPGPWTVRCWLSGEVPRIWMPRLGSPPTCQTARPPSSRVGIDARTAVRIVGILPAAHRGIYPRW
jgi:hypothetical protein